ncbi:MAG: RnfABCDGE type electron transport complex subunit D [Peptococcaceae bacterium]|jgi:electron transport complex protein RnfD|nr:RnfABCDGE type electron transport complex subunit D [Peptococcaceae bacterium]
MESVIKPLILSSSPHFHSRYTVDRAMREVFLSCAPAALAAVWFFGPRALAVMAVSIAFALAAEYVCCRITSRPHTLRDGSACVTGILLAFCLPPAAPLWAPAIGAVFAVVIGKQVFGGLGQNIFNPAHVGRAILLASFPVQMTTWTAARGMAVDGVTSATPLALLKVGAMDQLPSLGQMFLGQIGGCIGETSAVALLVGGVILILRKHVDWRIPVSYLGTVVVLTGIYGIVKGYGAAYPLYQLFAGGLMLGAFFMATDWVTSPVTHRGRLIFGLGLGALTSLIRIFGGLAEGVCYSILLMNIMAPLIDRYTRGRIYGRGRGKANGA